jgi:homoserine dehydrogenase
MFYGRGAGGAPTASAVLGDLVAVARNRLSGGREPAETAYAALPVLDAARARTRYYLHIDVADKAGVLAQVAQVFADHAVSIETLRQDGHGDDASLLIVTHEATEGDLEATVATLRGLDVVRGVPGLLRVVGEGA